MIVAGENQPGNHMTHAKGVEAILQVQNSPLNLCGAVYSSRSSDPTIYHGAIQVR